MHTDYKQIPMCPGSDQEIPGSVGRIIWSNTSISVNYGLAAAAVATGAVCKYHPSSMGSALSTVHYTASNKDGDVRIVRTFSH